MASTSRAVLATIFNHNGKDERAGTTVKAIAMIQPAEASGAVPTLRMAMNKDFVSASMLEARLFKRNLMRSDFSFSSRMEGSGFRKLDFTGLDFIGLDLIGVRLPTAALPPAVTSPDP